MHYNMCNNSTSFRPTANTEMTQHITALQIIDLQQTKSPKSVKFQFHRTVLEVLLNTTFIFKTFITQNASKLFDIRVYCLVLF